MRTLFFYFLLSLFVLSCKTSPKATFVEKMEQKHEKETFLSKNAIRYNIEAEFGGRKILEAQMTYKTDSSKGVVELKSGEKVYFDQDKVFCTLGIGEKGGARSTAFTWSYFFMLPYKMSDPGTIWTEEQERILGTINYNTKKLSFESGTGDAPEDWYILYTRENEQLLEVAAYIVTGGRSSQEEAEKDPHAIQYLDYRILNGVPIAREWKFWGWQADKGLTKELGGAKLTNMEFLDVPEAFFKAPDGLVEE